MKTLSGTFKLVLLAAIGLLTILTFRAFAQKASPTRPPPRPYVERKLTLHFKDALVKSESHFKEVICAFEDNQYRVHMKHANASQPDEDWPPCDKLGIKTDKVTISEVAKNTSGEELTLIQSHVTHQATSNNAADITKLLDEFQ